MSQRFTRLACICSAAALLVAGVHAPARGQDAKAYQKVVDRAVNYLELSQKEDGSFSNKDMAPAVTAIVITSLLENGRPATDPVVAKGLKFLEGFVQPSGGIHAPKSRLVTYETCVIVMCFKAANHDGQYDKILAGADKFLKGAQLDEGEGLESADTAYGGAGYAPGTRGRPDLSNTHFLVEALRATGNAPDSEAVQKALVFINRCQNLESEHNTTPLAAKVNDGGFYYTPVTGEGKKVPEGGMQSYGSMTYAGIKSMIFAGVDKNDKRVKAAVEWVQKNFDLKSNPGQGTAGLYYYYQLFGKALDAMEMNELKDAQGKAHNWRAELLKELASRQQPNGAWVNDNEKWMEGDPHLATGFALLALAHCRPQ